MQRNLILPIICSLLLFSKTIIFSQTFTSLHVFKATDSSRIFDNEINSPRHFRPVKIDLYYPSTQRPTVGPLKIGDLMDMYEQRMDYSVTTDSGRTTSKWLAKLIGEELKVDTTDRMLTFQTDIYTDLPFPAKKLPLIIYASGMNGNPWEQAILFDSLTKAGYVIAAISSVGLFPGYMSGADDMDEQVQDILYTIKRMKELPFVDKHKVGLLSWSLGGTAISKTAVLCPEVAGLVSLDGTEIHYYGFNKDWDKDFDKIMNISPTRSELAKIMTPYLYLSGEHPAKVDSIYNCLNEIASPNKYFLKFKGARHEDFSSIITIERKMNPTVTSLDESKYQQVIHLVRTFFDEYLRDRNKGTTKRTISQMIKVHPDKYTIEVQYKG